MFAMVCQGLDVGTPVDTAATGVGNKHVAEKGAFGKRVFPAAVQVRFF